jgi:hypothetical protein
MVRLTKGCNSKTERIVIGPYADPVRVVCCIVDPGRICPAKVLIDEVISATFPMALRLPGHGLKVIGRAINSTMPGDMPFRFNADVFKCEASYGCVAIRHY